jgi:hypothetical protein
MSAVEQALFNKYFDPTGSGVDAGFAAQVLVGFQQILNRMSRDVVVECEPTPTDLCSVAGRYGYTWWGNIHVCPHYFTMTPGKQVRAIIHEMTHNALYAVDRAYFHETDFASLTPRGTGARNIPFLGPLFTLIARSDTLNNPDSYACFANELGGGPSC